MFICKHCGRNVEARQPQNKVLMQTRTRRDGSLEIAQENAVCPDCYKELTGEEPVRFLVPDKLKVAERKKEQPRKKRWSHPQQRKPIVEVVNPLLVEKEYKKLSRQERRATKFTKSIKEISGDE